MDELAKERQETIEVRIDLPVEVEQAMLEIVRHHWAIESKSFFKLSSSEQVGHIFRHIRVLDDWLFQPTARIRPKSS